MVGEHTVVDVNELPHFFPVRQHMNLSSGKRLMDEVAEDMTALVHVFDCAIDVPLPGKISVRNEARPDFAEPLRSSIGSAILFCELASR